MHWTCPSGACCLYCLLLVFDSSFSLFAHYCFLTFSSLAVSSSSRIGNLGRLERLQKLITALPHPPQELVLTWYALFLYCVWQNYGFFSVNVLLFISGLCLSHNEIILRASNPLDCVLLYAPQTSSKFVLQSGNWALRREAEKKKDSSEWRRESPAI